MEGISYKGDPRAVLCHFNEKHDSNGRFAKKSGGTSGEHIADVAKRSYLNVSRGERIIARKWGIDAFERESGFNVKDAETLDQATSMYPESRKIVNEELIIPAILEAAKDIARCYMEESSAYSGLRDGKYHNANEYLTGSGLLFNTVYSDLTASFSSIPFAKIYLDSDKGRNEIAEMIGKLIGAEFALQKAQSATEVLKDKRRKKNGGLPETSYAYDLITSDSKGIKVRKESVTREMIKKQNPDLPATAIDEMYKAMKKENKSMRGGSSMPSSTVKHEISYKDDPRAVLCHFNPNHNPQNGQFTSGSSFGMDKYVTTDAKGKRVLTEAGMARWEYDKKRNAQKKKDDKVKDENQLIDPHRWVKEDLDAVQQGLQNAQNMTKSLSDFEKKKLAQRPLVRKKKLDLSEMTDQDLNNQINRYLLEQRYQDIFNPKEPPEVSKGKKWLMNTLEVAGGALAVGVSAVTIAKAVHDMKKGT